MTIFLCSFDSKPNRRLAYTTLTPVVQHIPVYLQVTIVLPINILSLM
jgi:hypothetical protein